MDKSKLAVDTYNKIADIYTKQYSDDFSDSKYIDKFLDYLPDGASILDIGSGPGQFSKYMADKGFKVLGIDYSEKMISIARKKMKGIEFRRMDMRKLDFKDNFFDGALASYSLIHIPSEDIPETLKGFYRILKSSGYIEIIAQKGEPDKIIDEPFMPAEKMFFNFFTKKRISDYLKDAGFVVVFQEETKSPDPNSVGNKIIYTIARKLK